MFQLHKLVDNQKKNYNLNKIYLHCVFKVLTSKFQKKKTPQTEISQEV